MAMATSAATITMSMREADRLKTIQAVVDRMACVGQAVQRLGAMPYLHRFVIATHGAVPIWPPRAA
jgi:hypothetical protein